MLDLSFRSLQGILCYISIPDTLSGYNPETRTIDILQQLLRMQLTRSKTLVWLALLLYVILVVF